MRGLGRPIEFVGEFAPALPTPQILADVNHAVVRRECLRESTQLLQRDTLVQHGGGSLASSLRLCRLTRFSSMRSWKPNKTWAGPQLTQPGCPFQRLIVFNHLGLVERICNHRVNLAGMIEGLPAVLRRVEGS